MNEEQNKHQCGLDLVLAGSLGTGLRTPAGSGCALSVPHWPSFPGLLPPNAAGSLAMGLWSLACGWRGSWERGSACRRLSRPGWGHGCGPSGCECWLSEGWRCRGRPGSTASWPELDAVVMGRGTSPSDRPPLLTWVIRSTVQGRWGGQRGRVCKPPRTMHQTLTVSPFPLEVPLRTFWRLQALSFLPHAGHLTALPTSGTVPLLPFGGRWCGSPQLGLPFSLQTQSTQPGPRLVQGALTTLAR